MIEKFCLPLLLLCITAFLPVSAQTYTAKDFNNIKRSQQYYYAEVTDKNEDTARDLALKNLINEINTELAAVGKQQCVTKTSITGVEWIHMERSTGEVRMMAYCRKSTFSPVKQTKTLEQFNKSDTTHIVVIRQHKSIDPEKNVLSEAPRKVIQPEVDKNKLSSEKVDVTPTISASQQQTIEELLKNKNFDSFFNLLQRQKGQYKVKRYGSMEDCKQLDQCFLGVFDENANLKAFLAPGLTECRYDYVSNSNSSLSAYTSTDRYSIIWIQLTK